MTEGEAQNLVDLVKPPKLTAQQILEAVHDEEIRTRVGVVLERDRRTLSLEEFNELRDMMAELGITGESFPRIVFACVQDLKRTRGMSRGRSYDQA